MLAWWGYATTVSVVVSVAAWLAARALRASRRPTRWSWAAAMLVSIAWPSVAALGWLPSLADGLGLGSGLELPAAGGSTAVVGVLALGDAWIPWAWPCATVGLVLAAVAGELALRRRCGRSVRLSFPRVRVALSGRIGPATFGLLRPVLILPDWVLRADERDRRLILIHELHHLRARDNQLLWLAWAVVCAMPWNPAVWWQYARLRAAVEIDCDRRSLRTLAEPRRYGDLLLRVAASGPLRATLAVGLLDRRHLLAERIAEIAGAGPPLSRRPASLVAAGVCAALALAVPVPHNESVQEVVVTATGVPDGAVFRARATPAEPPGEGRVYSMSPGEAELSDDSPARVIFEARPVSVGRIEGVPAGGDGGSDRSRRP